MKLRHLLKILFILISCVTCATVWYIHKWYLVSSQIENGTPHLQTNDHESVPISDQEPLLRDIILDKTRDTLNRSHDTGYVLALSYQDQLTSSSHRLVSLSCWAKQWNMTVVSPFVSDTFFRVPLQAVSTTTTAMKYDEIFNISKLNTYCEEHSLSPFAPWEDFLQNAPRDVVLVDLVYNTHVKSCKHTMFSADKDCNFRLLKDFWSQMLAPHHFTILKKVCIDLNQHMNPYVTMEKFNALFWKNSGYSPNSVSLVLNEWKGLAPSLRRKIDARYLMECHIHLNTDDCLGFTNKYNDAVFKLLSPNSRLFRDAELYISKYLGESNSYIAVMVRWEWAGMQRVNHNSIVMHDIVKDWQRQENVTGIFLTTDVGKYGSEALTVNPYIENIIRRTRELFKMLYGKVISLEDYSKSFEDVSNSTHPAYIGQLQRVVAAKARCLLMVGGGHFQQQTLNLYNELHGEQRCFKTL